MARQRVNTTFVILLSVVLLLMAGGVGVAYFMLQTSAEEHFAQGEQAFAEGDYAAAKRSLGNAVNEAPSNTQYLARYRDVLELVPVDTITKAREAQEQYLQAMRELVDKSADDEAFTQLMDWYLQQGGGFRQAHAVATTVLQRDPSHLQALRTRGYVQARYVEAFGGTSDTQAVEDLAKALAADPNDGRSQYAMALWHLAEAEATAEAGLREAAQDKRLEAVAVAGAMYRVDPTDVDRIRWYTEVARRSGLVKHRLSILPKLLDRLEAATEAGLDGSDQTLHLREAAFELRTGDQRQVSLTGPNGLVVQGVIRARDLMAKAVEANPDDLALLAELASLQESSGDLAAATASYERLAAADAGAAPFERFLRAYNLSRQAKYIQSRLVLRRALTDETLRDQAIATATPTIESLAVDLGSEDAPQVRHLRGLMAMLEGRDADALFELDQAVIASQLNDSEVLKDAAQAALQAGRSSLALSWLERYTQLNPLDLARRVGLAELYLREARAGNPVRDYYEAAADEATRLQQIAPRLLAGRWVQAQVLAERDRAYLQAVQTVMGESQELDLLQVAEQQPAIFNQVATWLSRAGETDSAREMRRQRFEAAPQDADNAYRYALLLEGEAEQRAVVEAVRAAGVDQAALLRMETALFNPDALPDLGGAGTLSPRDRQARQMQAAAIASRWDEVDDFADEMLAADPADDEAWSYRLRSAVRTQGEEAAQAVVRAAQSATDGRAADSLWRGRLALFAEDFGRAQTLLARAVQADPTNARAQADLGQAYLGLKRIDEAVESFEASIRYADGDALRPPYLGLINAYATRNEWERVLTATPRMPGGCATTWSRGSRRCTTSAGRLRRTKRTKATSRARGRRWTR